MPSVQIVVRCLSLTFNVAVIAEKKPIRKPDPNLRQLQRQISFGSGAPLIGIGSLKKKQMSTGTHFFSKILFLDLHEWLS